MFRHTRAAFLLRCQNHLGYLEPPHEMGCSFATQSILVEKPSSTSAESPQNFLRIRAGLVLRSFRCCGNGVQETYDYGVTLTDGCCLIDSEARPSPSPVSAKNTWHLPIECKYILVFLPDSRGSKQTSRFSTAIHQPRQGSVSLDALGSVQFIAKSSNIRSRESELRTFCGGSRQRGCGHFLRQLIPQPCCWVPYRGAPVTCQIRITNNFPSIFDT